MRLSCVQENLAKGLAAVGRAVATRSTLPVLSNVLLETDGGRLKLAATNLEIGVTCWVGAMVESEGSLTIPGKLLGDLVSSLSADRRINLAAKGNSLHVTVEGGGFDANLRGIPAEEFPVIPQVTGQPSWGITPRELQEGLSQVAFAAATDDTRPILAGVQFAFRGNNLHLAAADGFRLAVREVEVAQALGEDLDLVVPARAVQELARILGDQEEPVEITITPNRNQVLFHLNSIDLVSRLIEGTFPNVQQIIPSRFATRVLLSTKEFGNAVKVASLIARDANNIVKISIDGERSRGPEGSPGSLIAAAQGDVGEIENEIGAVVEGEQAQLTIAFNGKFVQDVLGAVTTSQVSLEMNSPSSPGVLRPVGGPDLTHVIMPMHLTRKE